MKYPLGHKIIHVNSSFARGGLELFSVKLARAQLNAGLDVCLLSDKKSYIYEYARSLRVPSYGGKSRWDMLRFLCAQKSMNKRIVLQVHINKDLPMCVIVRRLFFKEGMKLVYRRGSKATRKKDDPYHKIMFREVNLFITNSIFLKHNVLDKYCVEDRKVITIHNYVDLERFSIKKENPSALKKELGLPMETTVFAQIASYSVAKCPDMFIKAAKICCERLKQRPVAFVLVGDDNAVGFTKEIKSLAYNLGMSDKIFFLGFRRDISNILAGIDCLVLSSKEEPCANVVLEAMAMGKPCVGTKAGGTVETLLDGKTGLLVSPFDIQGLAKAMVYMAKNSKRAKQFGQEGFLRARECFNESKCINEYSEAYTNLWK